MILVRALLSIGVSSSTFNVRIMFSRRSPAKNTHQVIFYRQEEAAFTLVTPDGRNDHAAGYRYDGIRDVLYPEYTDRRPP